MRSRSDVARYCILAAAWCLAAAPCAAVTGARFSPFSLGSVERLPEAPAVLDLEEEARSWSRIEGIVGSGNRRRLAEARLRLEMQPMFFDDPELDPNHEWVRRAVRDGYAKLYRELLEERFPLDAAFERGVRSRFESRQRPGGDQPSWRPLISPRLGIGSNSYVGLRLRFPSTGLRGLEHVTLQMRQGLSDGEAAIGLRYSDGPRYFQIEAVDGDPDTGRRYGATFRIRF